VETWWVATRNDILDCDDRTGRGMGTTQAVAAERIHRTTQTVYNVRRVNRQLGICVEYYRGRELSQNERHNLPSGHTQMGLANLYAYGIYPAHYRAQVCVPRAGRYAEVARLALPLFSTARDQSDLFSPPTIRPCGAGTPPRRRKHVGLTLAWELSAHPGMGFLDGVPQVKYAALLKGHHVGGWHGIALGDALLMVADSQYLDIGRAVRNPFAVLKILLRLVPQLTGLPWPADPQPTATSMGATWVPVVLPTPVACGDCDHGWIQTPEGAAKCPTCPPAVRGWLGDELVDDGVGEWDGEPPF